MKKNLLLQFIDINIKLEQQSYDVIDYLQYDLNNKIYSYGEHIKFPNEKHKSIKNKIYDFIQDILIECIVFFRSLSSPTRNKSVIISNAYFNLNDNIVDRNITITKVPWAFGVNQPITDRKLYRQGSVINKILKNGNFKKLLEQDFVAIVDLFRKDLILFVKSNNVKALFLPQDIGFFEKLAIDLFKELKLPTFNFIHGLPGIYNNIDYNRTNYLVVWGESIKNNFVKVGFDPNKIIVNGHPKYNKIEICQSLRFALQNILIITKSLNGSQFSESVILGDRSNLIFYLLSIKKVLEKLGVKSVRLRPHPSENVEWYYKYIDEKFFTRDCPNIGTSLKQSTLVIGGTSTTFLEALIEGVNYVVYEPLIGNNKLIDGFYPVAPFDGSDNKVPVAKSEDELEEILVNKKFVDLTVLSDYISNEFNTDAILNLIKTN